MKTNRAKSVYEENFIIVLKHLTWTEYYCILKPFMLLQEISTLHFCQKKTIEDQQMSFWQLEEKMIEITATHSMDLWKEKKKTYLSMLSLKRA